MLEINEKAGETQKLATRIHEMSTDMESANEGLKSEVTQLEKLIPPQQTGAPSEGTGSPLPLAT